MKFHSKLDVQLFLAEIGRLDLIDQSDESFVPTKEMEESFIKRREPLSGALRDFRKSQGTKGQWRENRHGIMKGIKKFHASTEGKRFHRNLGRFLSSRYFQSRLKGIVKDDQEDSPKSMKAEESLCIFDLAEILKATSSIRTHAFIELEYFHPLEEELDYEDFLKEILPALLYIEKKLQSNEQLNDYDLEIMFRLVYKKELKKSLDDTTGMESKKIDEVYDEIEKGFEVKKT